MVKRWSMSRNIGRFVVYLSLHFFLDIWFNDSWLCLRTENRAHKTHVFENCNFGGYDGVRWGGVGWGGHVNVPCTLYIIVCYAAEISGIVATWHVSTLQRSLVLLLRYLLLRCRDLWCCCYVTCFYAAEISGVVATLFVTTLLMGWGGVGDRCVQKEISGIVVFKKQRSSPVCQVLAMAICQWT